MPLGTLDRSPPPFFRQGPSALSKLLVLSALSIVLMVVDTRRQWTEPLRAGIATALAPLQWVALQPVRLVQSATRYVGDLTEARADAAAARTELVRQSARAASVEYLSQENQALRALLGMRARLPAATRGAQILREVPDPYVRKVVIDLGQVQGVVEGSAVMDGYGVIGQLTRVYPTQSEVTLLTDPRQAIPVINTRTGRRSLAYGNTDGDTDRLTLRFEAADTEAQPGDVLTTSGIDGVYPPGLPVARIQSVSARDRTGFAQVICEPMARMDSSLHVLVVDPVERLPSTGPEAAP